MIREQIDRRERFRDPLGATFLREGRAGDFASDRDRAVRMALDAVDGLFPPAPSRAAGGPSRSRRDGFRPTAARDVAIYFISEACEVSAAEAAALAGVEIDPHNARRARARGAALVPTVRSKLHPDNFAPVARPCGKHGPRW